MRLPAINLGIPPEILVYNMIIPFRKILELLEIPYMAEGDPTGSPFFVCALAIYRNYAIHRRNLSCYAMNLAYIKKM